MAILFFISGYLVNMFYITVLYHRGLAHRSIILGPRMLQWLYLSGPWLTGMDPKAWACMHRVHHEYSDEERDPHSPVHYGVLGVWMGQYKSYLYYLDRMKNKDSDELNELMKDVPFEASFLSRRALSNLPYVIHALLAIALGFAFQSWLIPVAWFLGIMGHPIQGWMVNALAHKYGHRNFQTQDNSRNNLLVGYFVFGEGLQNNHHARPGSAKFSVRFPEFDAGYVLCLICEKLGLIKIARETVRK